MAYDGLLLRCALQELEAHLRGARVEKVYQPEPRLLWLHFYRPDGREAALVACLAPRLQRLHLSRAAFTNPPHPPVFCMVLRKHLLGARLAAARQEGWERAAVLEFARRDQPPVRLVLELAGPQSNAVLVSQEGHVLDALERTPPSAPRPLFPGAPYAPPAWRAGWDPSQGQEALETRLREALGLLLPAARALTRAVPWLGSDAARELCLAAGTDPAQQLPPSLVPRLARCLVEAVAQEPQPSAVWKDGLPVAMAAFPLERLARWLGGTARTYASAGAMSDEVYSLLAQREQERVLRDRLAQVLQREHQRAARRLQARLEDEAALEDPEQLRIMGEVLLAYLHQVPRGTRSVRLPNPYDPEQKPMEIPLDPALPPAENARRYFSRYQRAQRAAATVREKIAEAQEELAYLESLLFTLEQARGLPDLLALEEEMATAGLIRPEPHPRPPAAGPPAPAPLRVRSSDGWIILVGRNNRENDRLTFKVAAPDDYWLHAKAVAGAHVILRPPGGIPAEPPPRTLEEAALLAAYFSRARHSSNVPVDVTPCRNVRKPRGGRPGMVLYEGHRTLFVTPDPERVRRLLEGQGS